MNNNILKQLASKNLRIILWSILVAIILLLFYLGISPSGKTSYAKNFFNDNYFIGKLTPEERTRTGNNNTQKIVGDPAYFTLRTLRPFDKAKLTLTYRSQGTSIIEAGVLADKRAWRYKLKPLENSYIDRLSKKWPSVKTDSLILLERPAEAVSFKPLPYPQVEDLFDNLPAVNQLALYNYDLDREFFLSDYVPSISENDLGISLRGGYEFYVYLGVEDLYLNFYFSDLNKNRDSDPIDINIYRQGNKIKNYHGDDPGIATDNGTLETRNNILIRQAGLTPGLYRVEIKANDDVITDKIRTTQTRIVFINKMWLADKNRQGIGLFTDSRSVNVQTTNPGRLQNIAIGKKVLPLAETYKQYSTSTDETLALISADKDDIIISGDGVFGLDKNYFFNPENKKVNLNFSDQGIDYILADYVMPRENGGWKTAQTQVDLTAAYSESEKPLIPGINKLSRRYSFLISIPGLRADDNIDDWVEIKEIKIELDGASLWEKILD